MLSGREERRRMLGAVSMLHKKGHPLVPPVALNSEDHS